MRQIFDEDKPASNNMVLVFCEESLEKNGRQITVFSHALVEELRYQQRRNRTCLHLRNIREKFQIVVVNNSM